MKNSYYLEMAKTISPMSVGMVQYVPLGFNTATMAGFTSKEDTKVSTGIILDSLNVEEEVKITKEAPDLSQYEIVSSTDPHPEIPYIQEPNIFSATFSGADMVVNINEEVCKDIQSIGYYSPSELMIDEMVKFGDYYDNNLIEKFPVVITATFAIFDKTATIKEGSNITITYANEYGKVSSQSILDVHVIANKRSTSIDSIAQEETFILCAKKICPMVSVN